MFQQTLSHVTLGTRNWIREVEGEVGRSDDSEKMRMRSRVTKSHSLLFDTYYKVHRTDNKTVDYNMPLALAFSIDYFPDDNVHNHRLQVESYRRNIVNNTPNVRVVESPRVSE